MKMGYWKQLVFLLNNPSFLIKSLAFITVSVSATVIADSQVTTTIASIYMASKFSCAAPSDGFQRSPLVTGYY